MRLDAKTIGFALLAGSLLTMYEPQIGAVREHLKDCALYAKYDVPLENYELLKKRVTELITLNHPDHNGGRDVLGPMILEDNKRIKNLKNSRCYVLIPVWVVELDSYVLLVITAFLSAVLRKGFSCFMAVLSGEAMKKPRKGEETSEELTAESSKMPLGEEPIEETAEESSKGTIGELTEESSKELATVTKRKRNSQKPITPNARFDIQSFTPAVFTLLLVFFVAVVRADKINPLFFKDLALRHNEFIKYENSLPPCAQSPCHFAVCQCTVFGLITDDYYVYHSEKRGAHARTNSYKVNVPANHVKWAGDSALMLSVGSVLQDGSIDIRDLANVFSAYNLKRSIQSSLEAQKLLAAAVVQAEVESDSASKWEL